jgi:hypothetical protein
MITWPSSNIAPGGFAKAHGQIGVDPGTKGISGPFAVFENSASGEAALTSMLGTPQVGGRTIIAEMSRYASSKTDDPVAYANSISHALGGIDVNTRISALSSEQRAIIVQQIIQTEGSSGTVRFIQP